MTDFDPLRENAQGIRHFWDRHSPEDRDPIFRQAHGDHAVREVPSFVKEHHRDATGHTTRLVLRPWGLDE
jgi:hypothetical protein